MNILITGSDGFIGTYLTKKLKQEHKVLGIDRKSGHEVLNITKEYLVNHEVDTVIHLAAQTSVWNEDHILIDNDNIKSFIHIFNLCKELDLRFIYASSSCSINVTSMYGLSKQLSDQYAEIYGWDKCVGLRFHNVYGPHSRGNTLMGICLNNDTVTLYNNGNNSRHFTYIDDIVKGIVKAFNLPKGMYNIYNPEVMTTYEFCTIVSQYKPLNINCIPDIRELDKSEQKVDSILPNLVVNDAISVREGINNILKNNIENENGLLAY